MLPHWLRNIWKDTHPAPTEGQWSLNTNIYSLGHGGCLGVGGIMPTPPWSNYPPETVFRPLQTPLQGWWEPLELHRRWQSSSVPCDLTSCL